MHMCTTQLEAHKHEILTTDGEIWTLYMYEYKLYTPHIHIITITL